MQFFSSYFKLIAIGIVLQVSGFALAEAPDDQCANSEIKKIQRPQFPDRADSPTFTYSFRLIPGSDLSAPTVIYLPGGPGDTSIESGRMGIPSKYNVIKTDPRGIGCNAPLKGVYPDDFYQSRYLASDIIAIISSLNLSRFVLYGYSYGTLLATLVAHQTETVGLNPVGIVLEGTLGRARSKDDPSISLDLWRRTKLQLTPEVRNQFESNTPPLGLPPETWGTFIVASFFGNPNGLAKLLNSSLSPLASHEDQEMLKQIVKSMGSDIAANLPEALKIIARNIGCREFDGEFLEESFTLKNGSLVPFKLNNFCEDLSLDRSYDSAKYPLTAPLYYFQGEDDISTPVFMAKYHFSHQKRARRNFVRIQHTGHIGIIGSGLVDCKDSIWNEIISPSGKFESIVRRCKSHPSLEIAFPELD